MTSGHGYLVRRYNVRQEVTFWDVYNTFLFGAGVQLTAVNVAKFTVGRLRPDFFDVCKVNYTAFSCVDQFHRPRYVTEDVCTAVEGIHTLNMR